jgi:hypothetical protein
MNSAFFFQKYKTELNKNTKQNLTILQNELS